MVASAVEADIGFASFASDECDGEGAEAFS